jgi:hypothetical protein
MWLSLVPPIVPCPWKPFTDDLRRDIQQYFYIIVNNIKTSGTERQIVYHGVDLKE